VTIQAGQVLLEGRSSLWSGTKFRNSIHEAIHLAPTQVMLLRSKTTLVAERSANRSSGTITLCSKTEGNMKKTDSEIQQAVLRELKWDTRVEETDIGVEVDGGVVTLTGAVSSWAKRMAAQEAAQRVAGVLYVGNDVHVVPGSPGRTDTDIARAVRQALEWDVFVPEARIRSTVSDGWVTLEGDVDYWNQREDAERAIRNLAGVRGILADKIEIKPPKVISYDVRKSIEDALERQAEHEAKRIGLEVHDGRVTLWGSVHSWAEKRAVIGAAKGTPGVRSVDDHLRVETYA
jgi:osmotically-inducible protein OsmY